MMDTLRNNRRLFFSATALAAGLLLAPQMLTANIPGGGTGTGPNVTVVDNKDGTVTLANGIISITIVTKTSRLNAVSYTHSNGGEPVTSEILQGKGQYYYGGFSLGSGTFEYSLAVDPATNGGKYADVQLVSNSADKGTMETHFSMLRGSPGFYSTAIMTHRPQDDASSVGAWGVVTRVTPQFNWLSADAARNFMIGTRSKSGVKVPDSPHEITVLLDGSQQGEFADKFIYGQDHADLRAWGWSSVGHGGLNVGMWIMTNMEFSDGGPMKRDVSVYPYSELNNSILTGELGMGSDGDFAKGETWSKTCGPWFIYINSVPTRISNPKEAAQALFTDALNQAEAEKNAWPYAWFKHPKYANASERGTVKGKLDINDPDNPNASAAGTWVGLEEQPPTTHNVFDFQKWLKPYQFWTQADAQGNFVLPDVLPGEHYSLWAYGPGAAGTFLSQKQNGGDPPLELDIPSTPFAVNVKAGQTTELGNVKWTPKRLGATVFELGTPDRKACEFRHGDDYWDPALAPKLGYPTPVWGGQVEFPLDFPDGVTYTVGKSRWSTDWNYCFPSIPDAEGAYQPSTGTIVFDLPPSASLSSQASLYIACAGDDGGKVAVRVNSSDLAKAPGVESSPDPMTPIGFNPPYSDDSSIHFSAHGPFSDNRITFPASLLHPGRNTITLSMEARSMTNYLMVDYLRLELPHYVPLPPTEVLAYAAHDRVLVRWPTVPGATGYNVLRSTGADYTPVATDVRGPVCGSDISQASYIDSTAVAGTHYSYKIQSVNPSGHSVVSSSSSAVMLAAEPVRAPDAPTGLNVSSSGHHKVVLAWNPIKDADYYILYRAALHPDGVGGWYPIEWRILDDSPTTPTFTDTTCSDGRTYGYCLRACNGAGDSSPSATVSAHPVPPKPTTAPTSLVGKWTKTRSGDAITLKWSRVPGATGYVIYRSIGEKGSFTWPADFLTTLVETTYTDKGNTDKNAKVKGLPDDTDYSYQITAVNAGGISPPSAVRVAHK